MEKWNSSNINSTIIGNWDPELGKITLFLVVGSSPVSRKFHLQAQCCQYWQFPAKTPSYEYFNNFQSETCISWIYVGGNFFLSSSGPGQGKVRIGWICVISVDFSWFQWDTLQWEQWYISFPFYDITLQWDISFPFCDITLQWDMNFPFCDITLQWVGYHTLNPCIQRKSHCTHTFQIVEFSDSEKITCIYRWDFQ